MWRALLLLSCALVIELTAQQHISSSFVSAHIFGDLSRMELTRNIYWVFHDSDIKHDIEITVTEAYYGCVKEVSYKRVIPDSTCEVVQCSYCKNRGVIFTKTVNDDKHVEQRIKSPCPVCLGKLKAGRDGCRYYKEVVESVKFEIPRGARLGYQEQYPQRGNAVLDYTEPGNFSFTTGALFLRVGKILDPTNSGLNMTAEGLEINIVMTPMEALEGFTRKFTYFDDKVVSVDKTNKTTLPDTEVVMPDDNLVHGEGDRAGLLIRFTLLSIEELKEQLADALKQDAARQQSTPTVITSQEEFDSWEEAKSLRQKQFKRDCIVTKFLNDVKRRQESEGLGDWDNDDDDDDNKGGEQNDDKQHPPPAVAAAANNETAATDTAAATDTSDVAAANETAATDTAAATDAAATASEHDQSH